MFHSRIFQAPKFGVLPRVSKIKSPTLWRNRDWKGHQQMISIASYKNVIIACVNKFRNFSTLFSFLVSASTFAFNNIINKYWLFWQLITNIQWNVTHEKLFSANIWFNLVEVMQIAYQRIETVSIESNMFNLSVYWSKKEQSHVEYEKILDSFV